MKLNSKCRFFQKILCCLPFVRSPILLSLHFWCCEKSSIGDRISTMISFEKATFKKKWPIYMFEKIRTWWNLLKFYNINSVYIQPIWISRNIRMAHHSWFVVRLFSTKNINIEKTWTGLNVGFCYISNYIFCKCWVHQ